MINGSKAPEERHFKLINDSNKYVAPPGLDVKILELYLPMFRPDGA